MSRDSIRIVVERRSIDPFQAESTRFVEPGRLSTFFQAKGQGVRAARRPRDNGESDRLQVSPTGGGPSHRRSRAQVKHKSGVCDDVRDRTTMNDDEAGVTQLVECQPSKLNVAGSSPVARFLD